MFFFYSKKDGRVAMISEGQGVSGDWGMVELQPTPDETDKLKKNYDVFFENGGLVLKKPQRVAEQEKAEAAEAAKQALINNKNPTVKDVMAFLKIINA